MRHSSIETTLRYYVAQDADDVAEELWRSFSGMAGTVRTSADLRVPADGAQQ